MEGQRPLSNQFQIVIRVELPLVVAKKPLMLGNFGSSVKNLDVII
jgi:hypothetical protein